jgi:DNA end-binding protein Ku
MVDKDGISKGYQVAKDQVIAIDEKELEALKPNKNEVIEISHFVPIAEVDPIYFDKSYFVVPEFAGRKAYELLFLTMKGTMLAGFAKFTMRTKEYNVFLRIYKNGLVLHTVFADEEVRSNDQYEAHRDDVQVNQSELKIAQTLLKALVCPFDPTSLVDQYQERVKNLVNSKITDIGPAAGPVVDLIAQLKASIPIKKPAAAKRVKAAKG